MAALGFVIDVNTVPEPKNFETLPDADYNFQVTDSETVSEDDGKGYVGLTYTVIDGALAGRTHTERFYLWNVGEQRKAIALESLAALGRAIGVYLIGDTQMLHAKPFLAKIRTSKPNAEGKTYANASKYRAYAGPIGGGVQGAPAGAPFQTQAQPGAFQGFPQAAPAPAPMAAPQAFAPQAMPPQAGGMPAGFPMPGQNTAPVFPQAAPATFPGAPVAAPAGFGGFPGHATPAPVAPAQGGFPFPGAPGR